MNTENGHAHTCFNCGAVIGPGGDCEEDRDHDYSICDACDARGITVDDLNAR